MPTRASSRARATEVAAPVVKRSRSTARKSTAGSAASTVRKSPARKKRRTALPDPAFRPTHEPNDSEEEAIMASLPTNNNPRLGRSTTERLDRPDTRHAMATRSKRSTQSEEVSRGSVSSSTWLAVLAACVVSAFVLDVLSPVIFSSSVLAPLVRVFPRLRSDAGVAAPGSAAAFTEWSEGAISRVQTTISALESRLGSRIDSVETTAKPSSNSYGESIQDLNTRLSDLVERLQARAADAAEQRAAAQAAADKNTGDISTLSGDISTLSNSHSKLDIRIGAVEASISDTASRTETSVSEVAAQIKELRSQVEELSRKQAAANRPGASSAPAPGSAAAVARAEVELMVLGDGTGQIDYVSNVLDGSQTYEPNAVQPNRFSAVVQRMLPQCKQAERPTGRLGFPLPTLFRDPIMRPGRCWPMKGREGFLVVQLLTPVIPTSISYQHASRRISTSFSSAPKIIEIIGLAHEGTRNAEIPLGTLNYTMPDIDQLDTRQSISIPKGKRAVSAIQFNLLENHGDEAFTCVYRFRVHGEPGSEAPVDEDDEEADAAV